MHAFRRSPAAETHQRPEHGEHAGGTQDQQAAQGLGVVGFHHLDDAQQRLHARPPQVPHVQPLQVHQAGPGAAGETSSVQHAHTWETTAQSDRLSFFMFYTVASVHFQRYTGFSKLQCNELDCYLPVLRRGLRVVGPIPEIPKPPRAREPGSKVQPSIKGGHVLPWTC